MSGQPIAIKNARLIDPAQGLDQKAAILIESDRVAQIDQGLGIASEGREVIEAEGLWALPGAIDLHVHLMEPGYEYK